MMAHGRCDIARQRPQPLCLAPTIDEVARAILWLLSDEASYSTGAFLVKKNTFDRLSEENRKILREAAADFCDEVVQISRRVNAEAREVLLNSGIVFEK